MKRAINFLLVAALMVSMLSGCGASTGGTGSAGGQADSAPKPSKLSKFEPLDWAEVEEASAEDFTYELIERMDPVSGETVEQAILTSYTGDDKIINIPDKLDGYWVYRINAEVFEGNTEITHVRLPKYLNTVTGTWDSNISFRGCTSLLQVEMPTDPSEIPSAMFDGCTSLRQVNFNSTEGSLHPDRIESVVFRGCTSLTSIVLPESVTLLRDSVFEGCVNLETVEAVGVLALHDTVFMDCEKLENLKLNGQIINGGLLGNDFRGCNSLKTIEIVTEESDDSDALVIENGCLYTRNSEWGDEFICALGGYETVELRDDITFIPEYAFSNDNIKEIIIPASVEEIEWRAILDCENLEKISLEKGSALVIDDDDAIIIDCPSLKTIDFSNAAEVSETEFYDDCPKLKKVLLP